ncbi:MAG TPA: SRPBCC family protein [Ktedonobacterales bacterium]
MSFTAQRVTRTRVIHLSAAPRQVFPLFEPVGEKAWAEGWEPTMLFPADGTAEPGAVFTARHPEGESIWIMPLYDPASFHLAYFNVAHGSRVGNIEIQCREAPGGTTDASVSYTFTALNEPGNEFIANFTETHYEEMMAAWERAINYYLAHGRALRHHQY